MRSLQLSLVILAFVAGSLASIENYKDFKVYRVHPKNERELNTLRSFLELTDHFDFWSEPRAINHDVDVMVSPRFQSVFVNILNFNQIQYNELISDVESVTRREWLRNLLAPTPKDGEIDFKSYQRYGTIDKYLQRLEQDYPRTVRVSDIGTTYDKRNIKMIHISKNFEANNPKIVIDAGIHAREWIAPAQVLYIINQLVENKGNQYMFEHVDWLIIPVLNPDGYEHTHTSSRFWRKNRSYGKRCYGVDPNRNSDFHWNEGGASSDECSDIYAGPFGDSELEIQALHSVLKGYENIKMYLTFHSYGNYLLYPWGWTSDLPADWKQLHALAREVEAAIASVRGTRYEIGSSTNVLYMATGGSDDWAKGVAGIDFAYTLELPGGGFNGFDLPPEKILGVVEETWEGIKVYHTHVANPNISN